MIVRFRLSVVLLVSFAIIILLLPIAVPPVSAQQILLGVNALVGFDNQTNGFESQERFDQDRQVFERVVRVEDGLGPVYNATSCADCHQTPVSGGGSQVTVFRAGLLINGNFVDLPGGSVIHDRAITAEAQEHLIGGDVRTERTSLGTLGSGFVEAIGDETFLDIQNRQPPSMRGTIVRVRVLEANNTLGIGRFGWKSQHATLDSFSADALLNEMGITSVFLPKENTSNGNSVAKFDKVPDPEDDGTMVRALARFMRSTKAPPRDEGLAATPEGKLGSALFDSIGCPICHTRDMQTAPPGTLLNGFIVTPALGDRVIHPYGDFMLHDIGTGDGIVQTGDQATANKLRTAPLWGLRTRSRLMHDGASRTYLEAILRHRGEATEVTERFKALSEFEQWCLLIYLGVL